MRPLEVLPHQIGYFLTPNSFVGFNIVSMMAFVVRGVASYLVVKELLPGGKAIALGSGLVFALSPAADGMMLDRTIHVQWSGALAMTGLAALLVAVRRVNPWLGVAAAVLMPASLLMYEAALPVAFVMPIFLLVLARRGERRATVKMCAIYAVGLIATIGYSAWIRIGAGSSYQATIATTRMSMFDSSGIDATANALKWEFGGAVRRVLANNLPMLRPDPSASSLLLAAFFTVLAVCAMVWAGRRDSADVADWRRLILVGVLGLVWVAASLVIFLPFRPYRYETLRVHSIAQFGAVVVGAALAHALMRAWRPAGIVAVGLGVLAASFVGVQNGAMWRHWSDFQSQLISSLAEISQGAHEGTVVIRDDTDRLSHIYELGPSGLYVGVALEMVTGRSDQKVIICNGSGISAVGFAQMGSCSWTSDELIVQPLPGFPDNAYRVPRSDLLDLTIFAGDQPQLRPSDKSTTVALSSHVGQTAQFALPCVAGRQCADDAVTWDLLSPPFTEGFVRPYVYEDVPIRGLPTEGFGPIQMNGSSWRWTTATDSAVFARLNNGRYRISMHVLNSYVAGSFDEAVLSLNGAALVTERQHDTGGGGTLTAIATLDGTSPIADRLGIHAAVASVPELPGQSLGLAVDSVSVTPLGG